MFSSRLSLLLLPWVHVRVGLVQQQQQHSATLALFHSWVCCVSCSSSGDTVENRSVTVKYSRLSSITQHAERKRERERNRKSEASCFSFCSEREREKERKKCVSFCSRVKAKYASFSLHQKYSFGQQKKRRREWGRGRNRGRKRGRKSKKKENKRKRAKVSDQSKHVIDHSWMIEEYWREGGKAAWGRERE